MKNRWIPFVLAASLIGITGCANTKNDVVDNNRVDVNRTNEDGYLIQDVSNRTLRISANAARNVEKLKEVDQAQVIIRNNDAYAAVKLNNANNTGVRAGNGVNTTGQTTGNGTNTINQTSPDAGVYGNGYSNPASFSGTGNDKGAAGTNANMNRTGTDRNYKEVSNPLEQKIADQVRKADKKIHKVYVSYDTNFYNQMTTYTNDIRNGRINDGLLDDFNDTVRRFFQ